MHGPGRDDPPGAAPGNSVVELDFERSFANANMRVLPVQERSRLTVARILAAGRRIMEADGLDRLHLRSVATEANVRLGAIYRYFSTPEDLVRTLVRLWVIEGFDRDRRQLASLAFASHGQGVAHLVGNLERAIGSWHDEPGLTGRMRQRLVQDYYDVPYAEIWRMAGDVRAAMGRGGLDVADAEGQVRLAAAWAAAAAYVKLTMMQAPRSCGSPQVRATLEGIFWSAFRREGD